MFGGWTEVKALEVVLGGGLEPPCLTAYAPQTYVSAISPPEQLFRRGGVNSRRAKCGKRLFGFDRKYFRSRLFAMIGRLTFFFASIVSSLGGVTIPSASQQVVLVTSPDWASSKASVRLFTKTGGAWTQTGPAMDAMTGRNGMGWGDAGAKPNKVEGDGRAPAGVFRFGVIFSKKRREFAMPSILLTPSHEGVDDPKSRYYNQLVDRRKVRAPDWKTSEKMYESPHYHLGIWVRHNPANTPGAGSCIYLHEWVGRREGTAGCTILRRDDLERLLGELRPEKNPVLIQLPEPAAKESGIIPVLRARGF